MRRITAALFLGCLISLLTAPVRSQELPVFDAHIHYNQPDWSSYSWVRLAQIQTGPRAWLSQLPRDVAEKLVYRNAQKFVGLP